MLREDCFLIDESGGVLWADAGPNASELLDSPARWQAIWRLRARLVEVAHSHPVGPLAFSKEDETTMAALAAALGRQLRFSVLAPGGMLARVAGADLLVVEQPAWAARLRRESGMALDMNEVQR